MSGVNITILEGGKAENFGQVTKLRTDNGLDHDLWVPKIDVKTGHLSVKKNGLYYTNEYIPQTADEQKNGKFYDIYGWDTITVSVKKKTKGKKKKKKPDGSEVDVPVKVEVDDDGNLIETELPTSIRITTLPRHLNYTNGQSISIDGIIVHGYLEDGTDWGEVPFEELFFEPTIAQATGWDEATSDLIDGSILYGAPPIWASGNGTTKSVLEGGSHAFFLKTSHVYAGFAMVVCSKEPFVYESYELWGDSPQHMNPNFYGAGATTINGKTVYSGAIAGVNASAGASHPINEYDVDVSAAAWTVVWGDIHSSGEQEILVTWDSEDMEETLSDTYEITVSR